MVTYLKRTGKKLQKLCLSCGKQKIEVSVFKRFKLNIKANYADTQMKELTSHSFKTLSNFKLSCSLGRGTFYSIFAKKLFTNVVFLKKLVYLF